MKRLLLLAGAGEARAVAQGLAEMGAEAVASLEGSARFLSGLALPTRHGGFGGAAGFERYLDEQEIAAVLDVTHPFAEEISART
ncbi:MAG: precorrin-6A/cobalt-precorrin-6A reductase, partial [Lentibacter algarum]